MRRKWVREKSDQLLIEKLKKETLLDDLTLQVLTARGIDTPEAIEYFMRGTLEDIHDPRLLKDAEKAVAIIKEHILNKWVIVIYTDYDSDGAHGGAIAVELLEQAGATVYVYANNRFKQGYGLCKSGIDEICKLYPDVKLIVTVDNGISAFNGAEYAKNKGLNLIITDHHEPNADGSVPLSDAVVNPKQKNCKYPFKGLCGAGVIWKVLFLLYWEMDMDINIPYNALDMVAVATVGDLVPLLDENRILVKAGLEIIKEDRRLAYKHFREINNLTEINAHYVLAYKYVPMINAIGRLDGVVDKAIHMLLSKDEEEVKELVQYLYDINEKRKKLTAEQEKVALDFVNKYKIIDEKIPEVLVVYNKDFHEGIIGLIAGRLKETFNTTVIVFTDAEGCIKGSARSIEAFNIKEALDKCQKCLLGYGGHDMAAGLSMSLDKLDNLDQMINAVAKQTLTEDDFIKKYKFVSNVTESMLSFDTIEALKELEPFGMRFSKPLIRLSQFQVDKTYVMGDNKEHLKLVGKNGVSILAWRGADHYKAIGEPSCVKVLGSPEFNVYNNNVSIQFIVDGDNLYDN